LPAIVKTIRLRYIEAFREIYKGNLKWQKKH
jgi:hypothetical protein